MSAVAKALPRLLAILLIAGVSDAAGGAAAKQTSDAIERPFEHCLRAQHAPSSGSATLRVEARSRGDEVTHSRARLRWREADGELRVLLQMLAPAELAGSSLLLIETPGERPEAYAYLPEIGKVRRVGSRHLRKPMLGTTLTYADLERARALLEGDQIESWQEGEFQGRPVWQLEIRSGSEHVVTWLDRERCAPLRSDLTDRKGRLARQIEISSEAVGGSSGSFVPRSLRVRDLLEESETRVEVETLELGVTQPSAVFDPKALAPSESSKQIP